MSEQGKGMKTGFDKAITILEETIKQYKDFEEDETQTLTKRMLAEQRRKGVEKALEELNAEMMAWERIFENHKGEK